MASCIRLLSSTALWASLLIFAAPQLTASSPALAEEDAACQLTKTYSVKAPPELCRRLGGVPSTTEVDVGDALYDIWNENNRVDYDKAYGAAQAYLSNFPDGPRAEELRRWSTAYEKVMALRNTPREDPRPSQTAVAQPPQTAVAQPEAAQPAQPEAARPPQTAVAQPAQPDAGQPPQTAVAQPTQGEPGAFEAAAAEFADWKLIEKSRKRADFRAFIERYPDGEFTPSARRRLSALEEAARTKQEPSVTADGKRSSGPERGNEPPQETISIDGQTYIKGREPKNIGTVPVQALDGFESGRP